MYLCRDCDRGVMIMETKTIFIFKLLKVDYVSREGGMKKWWYHPTPITMHHTQSQEGGGLRKLTSRGKCQFTLLVFLVKEEFGAIY